MIIKIATRKSKLALIQTDLVIAEIKKHFPKISCEIIPITTSGDKIINKNLYDIGGKALFLKELEAELIAGTVDIAVHSLKDVPGILPPELEISAVLKREDPRDCLVSYKYNSIKSLPKNVIIGSSSVRRKVLLTQMNPDLQVKMCRGNIQNRLAKLEKKEFDAIILACAGLKRLKIFDRKFCHPINVNDMLPPAGQGIIAVQSRTQDKKIKQVCQQINHIPTWRLTIAERDFLAHFNANCDTPISAHANYSDESYIEAKYMYGDYDGSFINYCTVIGKINDEKNIALTAFKKLKKELINKYR